MHIITDIEIYSAGRCAILLTTRLNWDPLYLISEPKKNSSLAQQTSFIVTRNEERKREKYESSR